MERDKVKIGMKVCPFQKTVKGYGRLDESYNWGKAQEIGQRFLYVVLDYAGVFVLSFTMKKTEGDYFNPEDFDELNED